REASKDFLDSFLVEESGFVLVSHHQAVKFRKNNHPGRFNCLARIFTERKIFFSRTEVLLGQLLLQRIQGWVYLVLSKERPVDDVFTSYRPVMFNVLAYQLYSALLRVGNATFLRRPVEPLLEPSAWSTEHIDPVILGGNRMHCASDSPCSDKPSLGSEFGRKVRVPESVYPDPER